MFSFSFINRPLRFIKNDIDHFLPLHNSRHLFGLFDIFCQKKYKGFVRLSSHLITNLSCHQKSDGQSLIADITIGLVLGAVVGVGVLSVLNNETSLHLDKTPSKLEVYANIDIKSSFSNLKLQKRITDVLAGVIIIGGFVYLISNGFLLQYWVRVFVSCLYSSDPPLSRSVTEN